MQTNSSRKKRVFVLLFKQQQIDTIWQNLQALKDKLDLVQQQQQSTQQHPGFEDPAAGRAAASVVLASAAAATVAGCVATFPSVGA